MTLVDWLTPISSILQVPGQSNDWPITSHSFLKNTYKHFNDVTKGAMASQITSLTIVYASVYSSVYQSKHQSSALLAFVRGIHRGPVNSPHKEPVTRKMFPFDDVIINRSPESKRSLKYKQNKTKQNTTVKIIMEYTGRFAAGGVKPLEMSEPMRGLCRKMTTTRKTHVTHLETFWEKSV